MLFRIEKNSPVSIMEVSTQTHTHTGRPFFLTSRSLRLIFGFCVFGHFIKPRHKIKMAAILKSKIPATTPAVQAAWDNLHMVIRHELLHAYEVVADTTGHLERMGENSTARANIKVWLSMGVTKAEGFEPTAYIISLLRVLHDSPVETQACIMDYNTCDKEMYAMLQDFLKALIPVSDQKKKNNKV